jgi:hypothetical protein
MHVHGLPARREGLACYRITVPERPGRYTILEVPLDVEDPVGLVELFVASHLSQLDWARVVDESANDRRRDEEPPSDYSADEPPHQRQSLATG